MRLVITRKGVGNWAAQYVKQKILHAAPTKERRFVLGLPTGGTPLEMYQHLVTMHTRGELSFANVTTYNMDEYIGLPEGHKESYHTYMFENLFNHIDIDPAHVHILNGNAPDPAAECEQYTASIAKSGGVDLFLGGVGENGHIAFNEPYSSPAASTRVVHLDMSTRIANSRFFNNDISQVPDKALTVGIQQLMNARQVLILVSGPKKALALRECMEGAISHACPITALQQHPNVIVVADKDACSELRLKTYTYFKELQDQYSHIEALA